MNWLKYFFPFISDMPFPIFIRSILIYTRRHGSLRDLRYELIDMLREYKDCVKACEHQHSKRSGQFSKSYVYPVQPREIICKYTDPGDTRGGSRKISEGGRFNQITIFNEFGQPGLSKQSGHRSDAAERGV